MYNIVPEYEKNCFSINQSFLCPGQVCGGAASVGAYAITHHNNSQLQAMYLHIPKQQKSIEIGNFQVAKVKSPKKLFS